MQLNKSFQFPCSPFIILLYFVSLDYPQWYSTEDEISEEGKNAAVMPRITADFQAFNIPHIHL